LSERFALDASAVLAMLGREPGREAVLAALPGALLSTVNLAEVVTKLVDRGIAASRARALALELKVDLVELDADTAETAGALRLVTRVAGLSLGDRCCLALAKRHGAVALTTDRAWASVASAVGVTIRNIRPLS
jgi:ribonuclease VapC